MNIFLQMSLVILSVFFLIYILILIKKDKLELKYTLIWLTLAVCFLILAIFPGLLDWFAKLINIASPVNALFFVLTGFIVLIIFMYNLILSKQKKAIKELIQEISMLKKEVSENKK